MDPEPVLLNVYGASELIPGMNSVSLSSLAGRYENPIPPRCLAPIDFLKIPAQPKLGSFHRSSLKEVSRRLFRKIRMSPIEWEPFNARAPSRTVIAHYALNSQMAVRRKPLWLRLWFYIIQEFTNALWKSLVSMAKCGMNLFLLSSIILHW